MATSFLPAPVLPDPASHFGDVPDRRSAVSFGTSVTASAGAPESSDMKILDSYRSALTSLRRKRKAIEDRLLSRIGVAGQSLDVASELVREYERRCDEYEEGMKERMRRNERIRKEFQLGGSRVGKSHLDQHLDRGRRGQKSSSRGLLFQPSGSMSDSLRFGRSVRQPMPRTQVALEGHKSRFFATFYAPMLPRLRARREKDQLVTLQESVQRAEAELASQRDAWERERILREEQERLRGRLERLQLRMDLEEERRRLERKRTPEKSLVVPREIEIEAEQASRVVDGTAEVRPAVVAVSPTQTHPQTQPQTETETEPVTATAAKQLSRSPPATPKRRPGPSPQLRPRQKRQSDPVPVPVPDPDSDPDLAIFSSPFAASPARTRTRARARVEIEGTRSRDRVAEIEIEEEGEIPQVPRYRRPVEAKKTPPKSKSQAKAKSTSLRRSGPRDRARTRDRIETEAEAEEGVREVPPTPPPKRKGQRRAATSSVDRPPRVPPLQTDTDAAPDAREASRKPLDLRKTQKQLFADALFGLSLNEFFTALKSVFCGIETGLKDTKSSFLKPTKRKKTISSLYELPDNTTKPLTTPRENDLYRDLGRLIGDLHASPKSAPAILAEVEIKRQSVCAVLMLEHNGFKIFSDELRSKLVNSQTTPKTLQLKRLVFGVQYKCWLLLLKHLQNLKRNEKVRVKKLNQIIMTFVSRLLPSEIDDEEDRARILAVLRGMIQLQINVSDAEEETEGEGDIELDDRDRRRDSVQSNTSSTGSVTIESPRLEKKPRRSRRKKKKKRRDPGELDAIADEFGTGFGGGSSFYGLFGGGGGFDDGGGDDGALGFDF